MENSQTRAKILTKIDKMSENSTYQSESQNIYASMARIYYNAETPRRYLWDRSQLTNLILDSGTTCHMKPAIPGFVLGSLVETDKYIKVAYGHFFIAEPSWEVQIKMRDDDVKPFIDTLYNILFSPDLYTRTFSIITLMNLVHTFLFCKGSFTFLFRDNKQNAVTLPQSAQRKHSFLVKMKGKSKSQKKIPKKKFSLELLHQRLVQRSTRSPLAVGNSNSWKEINLRVDPGPLWTSCQISTINKSLNQRHLWSPRHLLNGCS